MRNQGDLPTIILTLVIAGCILFVGTYAVNAVVEVGVSGSQGDTTRVDQNVLLDGTNVVELGDRTGTDEEVYNSLGYAVRLSGANDSYVESTQPISMASDDTWTVATGAAVNSSATADTMTVLTASGRLVIEYDGSASEWQAWYYADGQGTSTQVNVSAPSPTTFTNVMVVRNGTSLTIYRNATPGESKSLSGESAVEAPLTAANYHGRLDETRTFDDALTATERNATVDNPVAPRKGTNRTSRVMYDEPDRSTQRVFFSNADLTTSNVTFADGYDGEQMDGKSFINDITGATDYRWGSVGPKIKPVSGGQLDGAPVAYTAYEAGASKYLDTLADDWIQAIQLAGVLFLLIPVGAILVYLQGVRGGSRR